MLMFVTGGVRSGKSSFAEQLALRTAQKHRLSLHYIATSVPTDDEMKKRIAIHRRIRDQSPLSWKTWEFPLPNSHVISHFGKEDVVLLDCLTTWIGNVFFHHFEADDQKRLHDTHNVADDVLNTIQAISNHVHTFILVSNELLHDGIMDDSLVFSYKRVIGRLHQEIVKQADKAFLVEEGIALMMKG